MAEFLQLEINAQSKAELGKIISQLLEQKLIACADVFPVESSYWWKGSIVKENRWQAMAFTLAEKKPEIIELVEKSHSDEVPVITFLPIEVNQGCEDWIIETLQ